MYDFAILLAVVIIGIFILSAFSHMIRNLIILGLISIGVFYYFFADYSTKKEIMNYSNKVKTELIKKFDSVKKLYYERI